MNDAPTPRTEEVLRKNACSEQTPSEDYHALAVHAEQLERELAVEREQLSANHNAINLMGKWLAAERALADRLAETLANVQGDYASTGAIVLQEVDTALAAWKASRDPNNLEGAGPTEEERRENARAIQALSVPERFELMFQGKEGGES